MANLLRDTAVLLEGKSSTSDGKFIVSGLFQKADTVNANGRFYRRSLWEGILKTPDITQQLVDRTMLGELGHPDIVETTLTNVSHIVTKLELKPNGDVVGEAEILDTPSGKVLKTLYEAGVKLGISSRGYLPEGSNLMPEGDKLIVPDDYQLVGFDFVLIPSTPGAYPSIKESAKQELRNILAESRNKLDPNLCSIIEQINAPLNESVLPSQTKEKVVENNSRQVVIQFSEIASEMLVKIKESLEKRFTNIQIECKPEFDSLVVSTNVNEGQTKILSAKLNRVLTSEYPELTSGCRIKLLSGDTTDPVSESLFKRANFKEEEVKEEMAQNLVDNTKYVSIIENLRSRYLNAEDVIADLRERCLLSEDIINLVKDQNLMAVDVIDNLRNRYLTAEQIISDFRDYTIAMEGTLKEVVGIYSVAEGVISDLAQRYTLSEGVIADLRNRYMLAEDVIDDLRNRHTLAEEVIQELHSRSLVSEQVIAELRDEILNTKKVTEAKATAKKKPITESSKQDLVKYFDTLGDNYSISPKEIKRMFERVGSNKSALEFLLEEKFSGSGRKYEELPFQKGPQPVNEEDDSVNVRYEDKLANIVSRTMS